MITQYTQINNDYWLDVLTKEFKNDFNKHIIKQANSGNINYNTVYRYDFFLSDGYKDNLDFSIVPDLRNKVRKEINSILINNGIFAKIYVSLCKDEYAINNIIVLKIKYVISNENNNERVRKFISEALKEQNKRYVKCLFWWKLK